MDEERGGVSRAERALLLHLRVGGSQKLGSNIGNGTEVRLNPLNGINHRSECFTWANIIEIWSVPGPAGKGPQHRLGDE